MAETSWEKFVFTTSNSLFSTLNIYILKFMSSSTDKIRIKNCLMLMSLRKLGLLFKLVQFEGYLVKNIVIEKEVYRKHALKANAIPHAKAWVH